MARRTLVVLGASAGGVQAIRDVVRMLPRDFPVPIVLVLHVSPRHESGLPDILNKAGVLPAGLAKHGEELKAGRVYVAPPNRHVEVKKDRLRVFVGPRVNTHRPSIDVLFESAARTHAAGAVGVILTGYLDDGAAGFQAIKAAGGAALVQDPTDALCPGMPESALRSVRPDAVAPLSAIGEVLSDMVSRPSGTGRETKRRPEKKIDPRPSHHFSCPDCDGVITEYNDGKTTTYKCLVGHAYSPETFDAQQDRALERALWAAIRSLDERANLIDNLMNQARARGNDGSVRYFKRRAAEFRRDADVIRTMVKDTD